MYKAQVPNGKITLLVIEAISLRAKSAPAMKGIAKHVSGLVRFYLGHRDETQFQLTGPESVVLIHDYLESVAERGRTVPATVKHALTVWAEALGIDWPLTNPLVVSAAVVEATDAPRQAPAMSIATVRALEDIACNILVTPYKRAFAAGVLLVTYASLRFSDFRRIRPFEINEDSVHGTLITCKTKKVHGQFWPWACPREGITGSREWARPLVDMRLSYRKINGTDPSFTFTRLGHSWKLIAAGPSPYVTTRRKLAILRLALGDEEGEKYTPHSPKNLFPTAANQLSFEQRELNIIGHWSSSSKMPERYDRSACANELLLRNTIVQRIKTGREVAPPFHLPHAVAGAQRIGREDPPTVVNKEVSTVTQESVPGDATQVEEPKLTETSGCDDTH